MAAIGRSPALPLRETIAPVSPKTPVGCGVPVVKTGVSGEPVRKWLATAANGVALAPVMIAIGPAGTSAPARANKARAIIVSPTGSGTV